MACTMASSSAERIETAEVINREQSDSSFEKTVRPEFAESTEGSGVKIVEPDAAQAIKG